MPQVTSQPHLGGGSGSATASPLCIVSGPFETLRGLQSPRLGHSRREPRGVAARRGGGRAVNNDLHSCLASSHCGRAPNRPLRCGRERKTDKARTASGVVPSLGYLRSKPVSGPLPQPRFAAQSACGSRRCRVAVLPHQAAPLGGGRSRTPVSFARIREDDARRGAGQPLSERIRNEDMSGYLIILNWTVEDCRDARGGIVEPRANGRATGAVVAG